MTPEQRAERYENTKTDILIHYVTGMLDGMRSDGLVDGGFKLCAEGTDFFKWLQERGFKPSAEELAFVVALLQERLDEEGAQ